MAAGLTVATTAGAQNLNFVKSLGATYAFEHTSPGVIHEILEILQTGDAVFDCIGDVSTQRSCAEIASQIGGGKVACVLWPMASGYENVEGVLGTF